MTAPSDRVPRDPGPFDPAPFDPAQWEAAAPAGPHVARTLGWTAGTHTAGQATVTWDATADHAFPGPTGAAILHGGLLAALLDNAMAAAAWTLTGPAAPFLTADIQVQLVRAGRPGRITADATVTRRTRAAIFCTARATDPDGQLIAVAQGVQVPAP